MTRPRLLDLFCGAGGAAMGYHRAGFDVVGVDIAPQPDYPFEFHQADALVYPLDGFDAIHASPPCQAFTTMSAQVRGRGTRADHHPELIEPIRQRLMAAGRLYVIENVEGASSRMATTLRLHGGMFGLPIHRPRLFESNVLVLAPMATQVRGGLALYGDLGGIPNKRRDGERSIRAPKTVEEARDAIGMPWVSKWHGVKEAIPPAYTEWIGRQLLAALERAA